MTKTLPFPFFTSGEFNPNNVDKIDATFSSVYFPAPKRVSAPASRIIFSFKFGIQPETRTFLPDFFALLTHFISSLSASCVTEHELRTTSSEPEKSEISISACSVMCPSREKRSAKFVLHPKFFTNILSSLIFKHISRRVVESFLLSFFLLHEYFVFHFHHDLLDVYIPLNIETGCVFVSPSTIFPCYLGDINMWV